MAASNLHEYDGQDTQQVSLQGCKYKTPVQEESSLPVYYLRSKRRIRWGHRLRCFFRGKARFLRRSLVTILWLMIQGLHAAYRRSRDWRLRNTVAENDKIITIPSVEDERSMSRVASRAAERERLMEYVMSRIGVSLEVTDHHPYLADCCAVRGLDRDMREEILHLSTDDDDVIESYLQTDTNGQANASSEDEDEQLEESNNSCLQVATCSKQIAPEDLNNEKILEIYEEKCTNEVQSPSLEVETTPLGKTSYSKDYPSNGQHIDIQDETPPKDFVNVASDKSLCENQRHIEVEVVVEKAPDSGISVDQACANLKSDNNSSTSPKSTSPKGTSSKSTKGSSDGQSSGELSDAKVRTVASSSSSSPRDNLRNISSCPTTPKGRLHRFSNLMGESSDESYEDKVIRRILKARFKPIYKDLYDKSCRRTNIREDFKESWYKTCDNLYKLSSDSVESLNNNDELSEYPETTNSSLHSSPGKTTLESNSSQEAAGQTEITTNKVQPNGDLAPSIGSSDISQLISSQECVDLDIKEPQPGPSNVDFSSLYATVRKTRNIPDESIRVVDEVSVDEDFNSESLPSLQGSSVLYDAIDRSGRMDESTGYVEENSECSATSYDWVRGNTLQYEMKTRIKIQETQCNQAAKALLICRSKPQFRATPEEVEAEKTYLIQCIKRDLLLEVARKCTTAKNCAPRIGTISLTNIILPLNVELLQLMERCNPGILQKRYFLVVASQGTTYYVSKLKVLKHFKSITFDENFTFSFLQPDFEINVAFYSFVQSCSTVITRRKRNCFTGLFKSKKRDPPLVPIDFINIVSNFKKVGHIKFNVENVPKQTNKPVVCFLKESDSICDGSLKLRMDTYLDIDATHSGFLNIGEQKGSSFVWNRHWCCLRGKDILCWNYPTDGDNEIPTENVLDLCMNTHPYALKAEREVCNRPRCLKLSLLENGDLTVPRSKEINYFLQADTMEDLEAWQEKLNEILKDLVDWNLMKLQNPPRTEI